ncbi:MAG: hypothetical protein NXI25_25725, partial [bacterium]|nr:hypothetical protein [bacterium]
VPVLFCFFAPEPYFELNMNSTEDSNGPFIAPTIVCPVGRDWLLWFEAPNRYVILSPSQKAALDLYYAVEGDAEAFRQLLLEGANWEQGQAEAAQRNINALLQEVATSLGSLPIAPPVPYEGGSFAVRQDFQLGNRQVRVEGQEKDVLELLCPTLAHHAIPATGTADVVFQLQKAAGHFYLYKNGVLLQAVPEQAYHYITGKFLMHIIIAQHQVPEAGWIGTLHASTVVRRSQAIMLTGQSGQGKSTLSTLLCSAGYQLLADDITPLRADNLELGHNPSAVSVKAGAFDVVGRYFPGFRDLPEIYLNAFKGKVKYLPLPAPVKQGYSCQHLVLVKYQPGAEATLQPVAPSVILKELIPDSWIAAQAAHAEAFMEWLSSRRYYKLTYSRLEEVVPLFNALTH